MGRNLVTAILGTVRILCYQCFKNCVIFQFAVCFAYDVMRSRFIRLPVYMFYYMSNFDLFRGFEPLFIFLIVFQDSFLQRRGYIFADIVQHSLNSHL